MSLTRRAFAGTERRAAGEWGSTDPPPPGGFDGGPMSEGSAIQIAAVYGSVSVIARSLATLPWSLLSSTDPAKRKLLPLSPLLKQPYVEISRMDWLTQYASSMALRGNFYGQVVERDQDLYPTQIKPINPDRATVRRLPGGEIEYRFNGVRVRADDVFHTRNLSMAGSLVGVNPIEALRITFEHARAQAIYGAAYFRNSANPEGVIEVEDDLDEDETLALARSWTATHGGVGKAHLPAVLTGGAEWKPISMNPKDSQFLESREFSAAEIAGMIFQVPLHMLSLQQKSTSWGTGMETMERGFVTNALSGYIGQAEEALTRVHPQERYVRFDLSERLRANMLERYQGYALGRAGGWLSPNRIAAAEGAAPIPADQGGDEYLVPVNTELVAQAFQSMKDSADAAQADAVANQQGGGADA